MVELWKYLALRTLEIKDEGLLMIFQAILVTRDLFMIAKFLIPSPPLCIGLQISSQALKQIGFALSSFWIPVHQNFLTVEVSFFYDGLA